MMRKYALLAAFLLLPCLSGAQDVTLSTPAPRASEAKYVIRSFTAVTVGQNNISVDVSVQDASGNEIRVAAFNVPDVAHPAATFVGLVTAMMTVRSGESANKPRAMAFRVLGYLADNGYFPAATLTP